MKQRLITGIVAGAVFLGMVLWGGLPYHLLILVMAWIGFYEFVRMIGLSFVSGSAGAGFVGVTTLVFPYQPLHIQPLLPLSNTLWLLLILFMLITVFTKNKITIQTSALLFLGTVYVGSGFSYIAESRHMDHGVFWTFLLLFAIWASDAGAYFIGKAFGRAKLWPAISPNKTIEGALGGVVIAVAVGVAFALLSGGLLSVGNGLVIGLSCAVVGQLGDLIQSAYKRAYGIKDTGNFLPGHGGILDRCDSWIVVFPFVHMLMALPAG